MANLKKDELIALLLMIIPVLSIFGFIYYVLKVGFTGSLLKKIMLLLAALFGTLFTIILWIDALGIINL